MAGTAVHEHMYHDGYQIYIITRNRFAATENARRADACDSAIADGTPVGGII
jgi:hypothetical protein